MTPKFTTATLSGMSGAEKLSFLILCAGTANLLSRGSDVALGCDLPFLLSSPAPCLGSSVSIARF